MTLEEQRACMSPLQLAGLMIMENGGETYRVEETITRMGTAFGLQEVESFAVPSGLFISFRLEDGNVETAVKRVRRSGTNLTRVDQVNAISRRVEQEHLTPEEALSALKAIPETPEGWKLPVLGAAVCAGGFTLMFGGGPADTGVSFLLAGLMQLLTAGLGRIHLRELGSTMVCSVLTTLIPMVLAMWISGLKTEPLIAGALMPMLPGLMMTNAIQDTMRGDMVSGLSHGAQAVLTAAMVAGGALVADTAFRYLTGGGLP